MNSEEIWAIAQQKAPHVARKIAREYPGIDAEDIQQEIFVAIAENIGSIEKTTTAAAGLDAIIERAAIRYASKERYTYLNESAAWIYTPKEIAALLEEAFFDPIYWEKAPVKDQGVTLTANGIVVSLWDIRNAWADLTQDDSDVIAQRYYRHESLDSTNRKRLSRAIDRLTQKVNGRLPGYNATPPAAFGEH